MKKKLISIVLSLAMVFSFTMVSAMAANEPTVTVETAETQAKAGDEVTLNVSIANNPGFTNYEWNIQYDKERLELTKIEGNGLASSNVNHSRTGYGYATFAAATASEVGGVLLTLTFTVKDSASSGLAEVKISSDNFKNNGQMINATYVSGGVTVADTTGGSTTGGSTTGGSTTGGSTTGGSTTGGSTTGGSTTGGSTTGGGETSDEYTITFNGNGGTPSVANMTTVGKKLSSLPTATHSGSYSFAGWYTATSSGTQITTAYEFSADTTVYAHWTYTGGGGSYSGGSSNPTYPVSTPDKVENGSVVVSPKNASEGDTVTVTVEPDSGYTLDGLVVIDKNGNELKLTEKGNGQYTFIMPAGKVEIKASFIKEIETSPFTDVKIDAYYYEAVKWAQEKGITSGIGDNQFGPEQSCTRAQIVTFLWRAAGSPEPKGTAAAMTDVVSDSYYEKAVAWAIENGITTGTGEGKFSPDATCTRAQAVTFLARALNAKAAGAAEFSDVPTDSYFADAVAWASANGVTEGVGNGLFAPDNNCTRGQIVTFLWRAYNK